MYAVFATGGKQYRAAPGDRIRVEKLDAEEGAKIELDQVLLIADGENVTVGEPLVDGGKVEATVVGQGRGKKINIIKFKRRKHHMKRMGHRQAYTELEIVSVAGAGKSAKAAARKAPADKAPAKDTKAEAAPTASDVKFLDAPQGKADDLQKISGVGPVLEGKLNKLGIFHYSQIAAFTAAEIAHVDEVLNFKGRIERDNWLDQAAELAAGSDEEE